MKSKIKYTEGEIGPLRIIDDFLPSPEELQLNQEKVRVTLNLNKSSIGFFKQLGKESNTPYQKVIRTVLDHYVQRFDKGSKG